MFQNLPDHVDEVDLRMSTEPWSHTRRIHMARQLFLLPALLFLASWVATASGAPLSGTEIKAEFARLRSSTLVLRPSINSSVAYFVSTDSGEAYVIRDPSPLFPLRVPERVQVGDVSGNQHKLRIQLSSKRLGRGQITLFPGMGKVLDLRSVHVMLHEMLSDSASTEAWPMVVGNANSMMAHARGANHLPSPDKVVWATSPAEATTRGFRLCPICFRSAPLVRDFPLERNLGEACAAQFREFNPLVPDDSLNERVRRVGSSVLSQWVVPLRGYDYRFYVVENSQPNAAACPTGSIFITTGLLTSLESDEELEAVLAHEIAHVERRHGYRQFKRAQTGKLLGGIVAVLVGASMEDGNTGLGVTAALQAVSEIATAIAISGYGRREEGEADSYALAFGHDRRRAEDSDPMTIVLAKLRYSDAMNGVEGSEMGLFMSHPAVEERLSKSRSSDVRSFGGTSFAGYNKSGDLVATITLEHQAYFDYSVPPATRNPSTTDPLRPINEGGRMPRVRELQVFGSVQATTAAGGPIEVDSIVLLAGSKEFRFDNKEDTQVAPGEIMGMNFVTSTADGMIPSSIDGIKLKVAGVTKWTARAHE